MKKRLTCLAVSLALVMQMLGGWSAFAADVSVSDTPETEASATTPAPEEKTETENETENEADPDLSDEADGAEEAAPGEDADPDEDADSGAGVVTPDAPVETNRVPAENNFVMDMFLIGTVVDGVTFRLEHWTPGGAPENSLCLWQGLVSAEAPSNGGWTLKPAANGHYSIIAANGTLTASNETDVVVAASAAGDPAQQWDVVLADPNGDPFDCKLVNVKYQTELTYAAPAASATLIHLAPEGAVWAIRNLSKSVGQEAYLTPGPSEEGGDRVAASNNFASDVFTLETSDGAFQVEHWAPEGKVEESTCLYGAYSNTSNVGNGGWMLTPVKDGYYCITTSDNGYALTALSETVVSAQGQTLDTEDPAQKWTLVPDETTKDPYDCKLENAMYGTQVVYEKPAANAAILRLAAEGDSWIVRNLKQSEMLGFLALVTPGPSEYVDWGDLAEIDVDGETGAVTLDTAFEGPQIKKVRVINEGNFLEIYWDRYVDEVQAINVDNFVLKNGDKVIELERRGSDYTNTLYFDKNNREIAATEANCMARLADDLHMSSIGYLGEIDPDAGLTLDVKGGAIKDESGRAAKSASYQGVPKVNYYTQFLTSKTGIIMKADDTVDPDTLVAAAAQVDIELSKPGTGIAENMAKHGCSLAIYSPRQNAYFIPEHRSGFRTSMYDVEGYGGNLYNNCVSSIAERNVLRTKKNPDAVLNTAYPDENILIHEFGHCIKSVGIETLEDQTLADELFAAYENAKDSGLWPNTYRISNSDEYFATMCAVWFNVMDEVDNWDDGTRCPLNTREELKKYDPQSYAFFEKILPSDTELPAPWNEPAPDIYHNEYVDPDPLSNQVEAVDSDFEKDMFKLETSARGSIRMIERYTAVEENPDIQQTDDMVCLWDEYDGDNTPNFTGDKDPSQKWTYTVIRTAEGYLRFVIPTGMVDEDGAPVIGAITALSDATVGVMGHEPDAADEAQQWKFVENTDTATKYDGKLVNVKYGTELSYGKPFKNGSVVALAPAGSGDNWFVRNVTQSVAVGKEAYLKPDVKAEEPKPDDPSKPDKPVQPDYPYIPSYPSGGGSTGSTGSTTTPTKPAETVTPKPVGPETSTLPDGSKMTVETKADGTKVTTVEQTGGIVSVTTETASGAVSVQVTVPETAGNGTIVLSMPDVPVASNAASAATVAITAPAGKSVKAAIPVTSATPGTVAVLVKAGGAEEVVKTSIANNGTLTVTLPAGGASVKIVDNSKSFADTAGHWSASAVAFVTARDLFTGTSAAAFSPDAVMTRGMLMTVLARYDGVDTAGGSTWYEKGLAWAKDKGISDGTMPEQGLSRQELVTMLYRYAGQPAASGSLASFPDGASAAQWAEQALVWASQNGIIVGTDRGMLAPESPATRAQVAAMLMRFATLMAG